MRIVDCFTDVILYARKFVRGEIERADADVVQGEMIKLFEQSQACAESLGMSDEYYQQAQFPVVALLDEMLLCSNWSDKAAWRLKPLQRHYFETTNAGSEFYDRLSELNKFGPDRDIREVYALCLGLGFRGKYFRGEDRKAYEEVKAFNLSLLLPEEAQRNIDSATLFPFAYKGHQDAANHNFKARMNVYPVIIGVPIIIVVSMMFYFQFSIAELLNQVIALVHK